MESFPPSEASRRSFRNRAAVLSAPKACCFYCLAEFPPASIAAWADEGETPLCPRCGIDSVLPGPLGSEWLARARAIAFHPLSGD